MTVVASDIESDHQNDAFTGLRAVAAGRQPVDEQAYIEAVREFIRERRFVLDLVEASLDGPDATEASAASLLEGMATARLAFEDLDAACAPCLAVVAR